MGIFITGSPNDRQPWLYDFAKSMLQSAVKLYEELEGTEIKLEDKAKLLVYIKELFTKITRLVDFASEENLWREEIADFLVEKGRVGLDAYFYVLSQEEPPTYENLMHAFNEQIAKKITQKVLMLKEGHLLVRRGFSDIVFERYDNKGKFISSLTMHRNYAQGFTNPATRQEKFEILRINSPSDKDKASRLFKFSYDFLTQKLTWANFISETERLNKL